MPIPPVHKVLLPQSTLLLFLLQLLQVVLLGPIQMQVVQRITAAVPAARRTAQQARQQRMNATPEAEAAMAMTMMVMRAMVVKVVVKMVRVAERSHAIVPIHLQLHLHGGAKL